MSSGFLPFEHHLNLQSVRDTSDNQNLGLALRVFLTVNNIVDISLRNERRLEVGPLSRHHPSSHGREIIVRVWSSELHLVGHALDLEQGVGGEMLIEFQEIGIVVLVYRVVADRLHPPRSPYSVEDKLLHSLDIEEYFLDNDVRHRRVLDNPHVATAVEE